MKEYSESISAENAKDADLVAALAQAIYVAAKNNSRVDVVIERGVERGKIEMKAYSDEIKDVARIQQAVPDLQFYVKPLSGDGVALFIATIKPTFELDDAAEQEEHENELLDTAFATAEAGS